jgi:predicted dehydrogenase
MDKHLLVIGAGSVGKRHLRNFASLGCRVSAMEPQEARLDEAAEQVELVHRYCDFDQALSDAASYSGVVVGSPPKFHVEQSIAALERNLPVYLEKPASYDLASTERLRHVVSQTGTPLLLGYSYRWWPPVQELRARLASKGFTPRHVRCVMSAHLADWHPWERYQDFFMSNKELGGGALLDESHFLDLMLWFFGKPEKVFAKVEHLSSLEIETDDNVDVWLSYANGLRVMIHLDLYGRPHERSITVTGNEGTLAWSYEDNAVRFSDKGEQVWDTTPFTVERNEMFMGAAREFLGMLDGKAEPTCNIDHGCTVMQVLEAIRKSSETEAAVRME